MTIQEHSEARIGKVWGEDDHLRLVIAVRKIEELAAALAKRNSIELEVGESDVVVLAGRKNQAGH